MTARLALAAPTEHDAEGEAIAARIASPGFPALRARMVAVDGCAAPIRLHGRYALTHAGDGTVLHEHDGGIEVPCGNRRETVCPACAQRYAADAFHLTRSGLAGGKGIPPTVAAHPMVFTTLTAPSFGPVHTRATTRRGRIARCRCGVVHHQYDTRVGTALDPSTYDYAGAVLWQAHASALWNRFTTVLRRTIAKAAGVPVRELNQHLRVSFAKVAEYQRRGTVHFHAVIRLDSFAGPVLPPPAWATVELLTDAITVAARATITRDVPGMDGVNRPLTVAWGAQLDIRPITPAGHELPVLALDPNDDSRDAPAGDGAAVTAHALAGYIAKYATKSTGATDTAERRIRSGSEIALIPATAHHRRLMWTCWALGNRPGLDALRRWAHMLGFGGHFLTKSRTYSTTFGALRGARREHARTALLEHLGVTDDDVLVVNHWHYIGHGWDHPTDREIAIGVHERHREQKRQHYRAQRGAA